MCNFAWWELDEATRQGEIRHQSIGSLLWHQFCVRALEMCFSQLTFPSDPCIPSKHTELGRHFVLTSCFTSKA